jgi:hypothetical protein
MYESKRRGLGLSVTYVKGLAAVKALDAIKGATAA